MFAGSVVKRSMFVFGMTAVLGLLPPGAARADDALGAHAGLLLPIVTRTGGETATLSDQFSIGFPIGITLKTWDKIAFDLELVPTIQKTPLLVGLTVNPGVLYALPNDLTAGLRMAFDVNQASWGFTPLVRRKIQMVGTSTLFGELVVPIRFQADNNSVGVGIHVGFGF